MSELRFSIVYSIESVVGVATKKITECYHGVHRLWIANPIGQSLARLDFRLFPRPAVIFYRIFGIIKPGKNGMRLSKRRLIAAVMFTTCARTNLDSKPIIKPMGIRTSVAEVRRL